MLAESTVKFTFKDFKGHFKTQLLTSVDVIGCIIICICFVPVVPALPIVFTCRFLLGLQNLNRLLLFIYELLSILEQQLVEVSLGFVFRVYHVQSLVFIVPR